MSGFDDNPFDDNPFQDPSIQQVTKNTVNNAAKDLEDYNPFDETPQRPTTAVRGAANPPPFSAGGGDSRSPAVMSPVQDYTPAFGKPQQQPAQGGAPPPISTEELQRRQEELERKERELQRREEELGNAPYNARRNNWPPLPDKLPVQPCFYQDINVDIPVEFQRIVRNLYYLWIAHFMMLLVNSLAFLLRIFTIASMDDFIGFGLSLFYIVIFSPASYVCWFRPAYKAFKSDSSFNFMVFFLCFVLQIIFSLLFCLTMQGACGIIGGIKIINMGGAMHIFVGIVVLIVGIGFAVGAVFDVIMLVRIHRIYRSSGASFAKAQQEFTSGVMRNEHVQGAAAGLASEALRSQVNRTAGGGGNGNVRY
ncbi:unnamed protein product [Orchesella dallaii]|uniref:Secretory carrier-associated membrane protein n=1 Tax=Orchesella dallaii TaxID=48710 RepID=A0ABP1PM99_9HEXA